MGDKDSGDKGRGGSTGNDQLDLVRDLDQIYGSRDAAKDTGSSRHDADRAWSDASRQGNN